MVGRGRRAAHRALQQSYVLGGYLQATSGSHQQRLPKPCSESPPTKGEGRTRGRQRKTRCSWSFVAPAWNGRISPSDFQSGPQKPAIPITTSISSNDERNNDARDRPRKTRWSFHFATMARRGGISPSNLRAGAKIAVKLAVIKQVAPDTLE